MLMKILSHPKVTFTLKCCDTAMLVVTACLVIALLVKWASHSLGL